MRLRGSRALLVSSLVAMLLAGIARATVVLRASVGDLADRCDRAVLGRVVETRTEEDAASGALWTSHRVRLEESWIGDGTADLVVSVPGGTLGRVTQEFHGGARLRREARVALFLWRDAGGRWQVLGEAQGAFDVAADPETGAEVCSNSVEGLALVDRAGKRVEPGATRLTLPELRRRVADARAAREDRERSAREARARRLAERRERAARLAALLRGRPGAPVE